MTPSMVDLDMPFSPQLEIPKAFLKELQRYQMELPGSLMLEIFDNSQKECCLTITRSKCKPDFRERGHFLGDGGWRKFVLENNVRLGDFLLFQLIRVDRFKVLKKRLSEYQERPSKWIQDYNWEREFKRSLSGPGRSQRKICLQADMPTVAVIDTGIIRGAVLGDCGC